jgi:hypothetical protein
VNEIAFVIATEEYGIGPSAGVEPVIDGVSVVDLFKRADGQVLYAGLRSPEAFLKHWRGALATAGADRMKILGGLCGDPDCSWATARVEVTRDTVVWSQFRSSHSPQGKPGPRWHDEIGPYQFDGAQYINALANPLHADTPIREKPASPPDR